MRTRLPLVTPVMAALAAFLLTACMSAPTAPAWLGDIAVDPGSPDADGAGLDVPPEQVTKDVDGQDPGPEDEVADLRDESDFDLVDADVDTTPTFCDKADFPNLAACEYVERVDGTCVVKTHQQGIGCDDGKACLAATTCQAGGTCGAGFEIPCDDGNPCTDDTCVEGTGCTHTPNTATCEDGNACTTGDHCGVGACLSGDYTTAVQGCECDPGADPGACEAQAGDGNRCNGLLVCDLGHCVQDPATVVACYKGNDTDCQKNTCEPASGACVMTPVAKGVACNDGSACTFDDLCTEQGQCVGVFQANGLDCLCLEDADCAPYDDGNACNGHLQCVDYGCWLTGVQIPCDAGTLALAETPCEKVACLATVGECALSKLEEGFACGAGDPCHAGAMCDDLGLCVQAAIVDVCNGRDDDCDDQTDEDRGVEASQCGVGACAAEGARSCDAGIVIDTCTPGAPAGNDAICDAIDDDCDGAADEEFASTATACGTGACAATGATTCTSGVPGDTCAPGTPAATDATCDAVDDDCDGATDEEVPSTPTTCGVGACAATGVTTCVGGAAGDTCTPGQPAIDDATCDAVDDDCDGFPDDDVAATPTACGLGACAATGEKVCTLGAWVDTCTPGEPLSANDAICDAIDDDCDGLTDDDYAPPVTTCGAGACFTTGALVCEGGVTRDTCQAGSGATDDATCDGVDDDCDGATDEEYMPTQVSCGEGACQATGTTACADGVETDSCSPGGGEGSDPVCNGLDDDCDGETDEDYTPRATTCGVGACAAEGLTTCVDGAEADSCAPSQPAADDATCDGVDDDCDGALDQNYLLTPTLCGIGACAALGQLVCALGAEIDTCAPGLATGEVCDGSDNDCDGAIDEPPACEVYVLGHLGSFGPGAVMATPGGEVRAFGRVKWGAGILTVPPVR